MIRKFLIQSIDIPFNQNLGSNKRKIKKIIVQNIIIESKIDKQKIITNIIEKIINRERKLLKKLINMIIYMHIFTMMMKNNPRIQKVINFISTYRKKSQINKIKTCNMKFIQKDKNSPKNKKKLNSLILLIKSQILIRYTHISMMMMKKLIKKNNN